MAIGKVTELDESSFETEVLSSSKPYLVDFWAEWCQPCKQMSPILEQIAEENPDLASIGKVDVEAYPALAAQYKIRSIPAMFIFKGGQVVDQIIGSRPKEVLLAALQKSA
jgi:thioredoxin 1